MAHFSTLGPNINWIRELCKTLDTTSLTSLVNIHWPTAGLWVNSSFLKAGIKSNAFFLVEGITIFFFFRPKRAKLTIQAAKAGYDRLLKILL